MKYIDKEVFKIEKEGRRSRRSSFETSKYFRFKITKARCPWSVQVKTDNISGRRLDKRVG
jgi:hypothetical protein